MHPLLLGAIGAGLLALALSAQIYLSMLDHGHSFVRMVAWQLCSWSVWALATPTVLRLGARLSERPARAVYGTVVERARRAARSGRLRARPSDGNRRRAACSRDARWGRTATRTVRRRHGAREPFAQTTGRGPFVSPAALSAQRMVAMARPAARYAFPCKCVARVADAAMMSRPLLEET